MSEVVGVDVAAGRWVAVVLRDGRFADAVVEDALASVVAGFPQAAAFGVDIPIGLPARGRRPADDLARARTGARWASVFYAAPLPVLIAEPHAAANELARELTGKGLSQQAYGLRHRILEAEPVAAAEPRVVEVHPEVSFAVLAGDELRWPKRSWNGALLRRTLLREEAGIELPDELPGTAGAVPVDDVLDATAAAWSAARVAADRALSFPPGATRGARGVIWA